MRDESASRFASLVLLVIVVFLVFIIASGTVWACTRPSGSRGAAVSQSGKRLFSPGDDAAAIKSAQDAASDMTAGESTAAGSSAAEALFSDVGLLRAATADKDGTVIVIQPYFPYPGDDVAFREELVKKTRAIRACVLDWFASRTVREVKKLGEAGVKRALLDAVNGILVLGSLDTVWFSEFMVLD